MDQTKSLDRGATCADAREGLLDALPKGVRWAFRFIDGPRAGETFPLLDGPTRIGRTEGNDLVIDDDGVSTLHAIVEPNGEGQLKIRDLESRNGTLVSGERVKDMTLIDGDVVVLGTTYLKFLARSEA